MAIGPGTAGTVEGFVAFYRGYFGAGLDVLLLALLTVTADEDLSRLNVIKNALAMLVTSIAVLVFACGGAAAWRRPR